MRTESTPQEIITLLFTTSGNIHQSLLGILGEHLTNEDWIHTTRNHTLVFTTSGNMRQSLLQILGDHLTNGNAIPTTRNHTSLCNFWWFHYGKTSHQWGLNLHHKKLYYWWFHWIRMLYICFDRYVVIICQILKRSDDFLTQYCHVLL